MSFDYGSNTSFETDVAGRLLLGFGALVALVATAGSLYLSLGLGLIPCELCWYQRILMYPLVVVLGVACLENRKSAYRTAVPLAAVGGTIAAYHSYIQLYPHASQCTVGCSTVQYTVFGLTVPNLSLTAFVIVLLTMGWLRYATGPP